MNADDLFFLLITVGLIVFWMVMALRAVRALENIAKSLRDRRSAS